MTSKELFEMLDGRKHGRELKTLHRDLVAMFPEEIKQGTEIVPTLRPNRQVEFYTLNEILSKMFVASKDKSYLRKITQYWINKAPKPMSQLTTLELCDLIRSTELARLAEVAKYESLNIEFLNVMEEEGYYQFITVSKLLAKVGLGRTTLMSILREKGILLNSNLPAQAQLDNGRFVVKRYYLEEVEKHCTTTLVTEKGFVFLAQLLHDWVKPFEIPSPLKLTNGATNIKDWFDAGWTPETLIKGGYAK